MIELTGFWLDIVMIFIFLVMLIIGLWNGFIKKIYDLISLFVVFFLTLFFYKPLASFLMFITLKDSHEMLSLVVSMTTSLFYQIIAFLILFLAFMILRKLLGMIIRPMLDKIVGFFSLIKGIDRLLGMVLYGCIGLLINACLLMALPMLKQDSAIIEDSVIAPYILKIAPDTIKEGVTLFQQLDGLKELEDPSKLDEQSFKTFIELMVQGAKLGLVDQDTIDQFILSNEQSLHTFKKIEISQADYLQLESLLQQGNLPQDTVDALFDILKIKEE